MTTPTLTNQIALVNSVSGGTATEGDYGIFTIELTANDIATTVQLQLGSGNADLGEDYLLPLEASFDVGVTWNPVPANLQLPIPGGVGSFQVRTLTVIDNVFEGTEDIGLSVNGRGRFGTVTLLDKPAVSNFISVSDASTVEGQQEVFTIRLAETTVAPTTVQLTLSTSENRFNVASGEDVSPDLEVSFDGGTTWTLVPANGQLSVGTGVKDFQVRTIALLDSVVEQNEVFGLNAIVNGEKATGTGTIIDTAPLLFVNSFLDTPIGIYEGEKKVFGITFVETTTAPNTIQLGLTGITATLGEDFLPEFEASFDNGITWTPVPVNGQLAVGVGVKDLQVRIPIIADSIVEETESFKITATIDGGSAIGLGSIFDGAKPTITVSDTSAIEGDYAVFSVTSTNLLGRSNYNLSLGSDTANVDDDLSPQLEISFDNGLTWNRTENNLTIADGVKEFKVRAMTLSDNLLEGNETFKLIVGNGDTNGIGTATIIDKPLVTPKVVSVENASGVEGETEVFAIGLSNITFEPTNIQLNLASGTATLGKDFSAILEASFDFGVSWSSVPTNGLLSVGTGVRDFQVRTMALIDNRKEATETFTLTASGNGGTANGTGTILDTPIAAKVSRVSNARVIEGEKEVFTIGLSNKTTVPTTVELNLTSGTAILGTDFSATLEASFDRGKTWTAVSEDGKLQVGTGIKNFQVRAMTTIDPLLKEGKETFNLTASANGGTANGTGTIIDKRFIGAIAIDLNSDGIQTLGIDKGVKFDIINSGEKVSTGWISNADAFLAFDKNGNGKIESRAELFGGGVGQGFAKLDSFDSNHDGLVNAQDARFGRLKVWQDKNSNGGTDYNELFSLSDVGIASLNTACTSDFTLDAQQNVLGERSFATTNTGGTLEVVNTYFQVASNVNFITTHD